MKRNIFWTILFLLTGGCTNEMIETSHHTLHIKGNEIGYFNSHSHSRLSEKSIVQKMFLFIIAVLLY